MIKRLTKHGNSLALVIDRGVLRLLEIDETTPLSMTTDGRSLIVSPAESAKRRRQFRSIVEKINNKHAPALKKLAE